MGDLHFLNWVRLVVFVFLKKGGWPQRRRGTEGCPFGGARVLASRAPTIGSSVTLVTLDPLRSKLSTINCLIITLDFNRG